MADRDKESAASGRDAVRRAAGLGSSSARLRDA
jgi:hypothetical protein